MRAIRRGAIVLCGLGAICVAACGASPNAEYYRAAKAVAKSEAADFSSGPTATAAAGQGNLALAVDDSRSMKAEEAATKATTTPAAERKIIYTGQLTLVVNDLSAFEKGLKAAVIKSGGFIAKIKEDRTYGDQRTGQWVLRVPANQFQPVIDSLTELGVANTRQVDSQDVTEEYVDLEGRIATKKKLLERLDKLLAEKTGDVKDVLAVQNELFRVQEEMERMQGRLKFLTDQTTFTTITVYAREDREYEPPVAPTFGDKIAQSWTHSFTSLTQFGENLVLAVVALTPWLICGLVVIGLPLLVLLRRLRTRRVIAAELPSV